MCIIVKVLVFRASTIAWIDNQSAGHKMNDEDEFHL